MEERLAQQPGTCIKIVLYGPESSGKTTLSRKLAAHYSAPWVAEYARDYLQQKWDREHTICAPEDILPIAVGQMQLENQASAIAEKLLFCDTDLLETLVYSQVYYDGWAPELLKNYAVKNTYHLYLLTYIDTPWEADDLRDRPGQREEMFGHFKNALLNYDRPFIELHGDIEQRMQLAINHINKLLGLKFTQQEIEEIKSHGLTVDQVEQQVNLFKNGVPNVRLNAPATVGNGIIKLTDAQEAYYLKKYEDADKGIKVLKFTPASGAASRMFKHIHQFLEDYGKTETSINDFIESKKDKSMKRFFENWKNFPFYDTLWNTLNQKNDKDLRPETDAGKIAFLKMMMNEDGLDFGNQPKGLLPFHKYPDQVKTAFEEHLYEAAAYATTGDRAELHFTVSPEHEQAFKDHFDQAKKTVKQDTGIDFKSSFSFQKPHTDTVAVTLDNELYRKGDGSLLFRPGGHGALIENLNEVDADVIFIKNIDNVLTAQKIDTLAKNKKILAGILLELQEKIFGYSQKLENESLSDTALSNLESFVINELNVRFDDTYARCANKKKKQKLKEALQRPLRICGMVKNEGEPGGGPFWVAQKNGGQSLQIIESAQVKQEDEKQQQIFASSTHFNPVDIVCGIRDREGNKYDLTQYVDADLAFIAYKTTEGNEIKALELPGLWNGAMALWNSVFVEVPVETFNPVKNVNDLLKPSHQGTVS